MLTRRSVSTFFFFNDTATTEIYTLSLHDALPISRREAGVRAQVADRDGAGVRGGRRALPPQELRLDGERDGVRSEEHTSELQSLAYLVCRLLLEKKKPPARCPSGTRDRSCGAYLV